MWCRCTARRCAVAARSASRCGRVVGCRLIALRALSDRFRQPTTRAKREAVGAQCAFVPLVMRWTPGGSSSDIEDRRGSGRGFGGVGGGGPLGCGGAVILLVLSLLFHKNFFALLGNGESGTQVSAPT